ncbi:hypothetical protein HDU98_005805 [Podochytrium sp. JEL0797]|nr:hypothetical protein HDU98_005805 [Podochytrium sp. JEL0797]
MGEFDALVAYALGSSTEGLQGNDDGCRKRVKVELEAIQRQPSQKDSAGCRGSVIFQYAARELDGTDQESDDMELDDSEEGVK